MHISLAPDALLSGMATFGSFLYSGTLKYHRAHTDGGSRTWVGIHYPNTIPAT